MPRINAESIPEHKQLTRRRILEAARENFVEFGYPDTALGDIALDADIGRTTLYEYFDDKEAILIELVNEELPEIIDAIVGGIPEGLDAPAHLGELVLRHLEFIADESNLGTILMRDSNRLSAEAQQQIRQAHRHLETSVIEVYERGSADGAFRPMDPALAAELVNAVTMYGARTLLRSRDPKGRVHAVADTVVEFLLNGLGSH